MFDIIIKRRGGGKTSDLIRLSAETSIPILSSTVTNVKLTAQKLGLTIPEPIRWPDCREYKGKVLIDDLDLLLCDIFKHDLEPVACTISTDNYSNELYQKDKK